MIIIPNISNAVNVDNSNKLSKVQKESIFLLSIGTFLEYFDLMLYVHMAVLLNELFFPQNNPLTAELFAIFTFCSAFVLRPIGGFIVGWIGDQVGRKNTIIITTLTMALCCLTMANIKTYAEIGITASIVIIICRVLQGFSSMGEMVGAILYIAETLKQPDKYVYNMFIGMANGLGSLFALVVASVSLSIGFNWRIAFWIGTIIALVGLVARTRLRETPEFIEYKRRLKIKQESMGSFNKAIAYQARAKDFIKEKVDKKALLALSVSLLFGPVVFYITYIYCGDFMKKSLGMAAAAIINQNLRLNIVAIFALLVIMYLLRKHHPLKLAKINILISSLILIFVPYWFYHVNSLLSLLCLQIALHSFTFTNVPVNLSCFKHIPLARRFTILATTFGVATAIAYIAAPIILAFLTRHIGHYALWVLYIPLTIAYWYAINYIKKLEMRKGLYTRYPDSDDDSAGNGNTAESTPEKYTLGEDYQAFMINCTYAKALLNEINIAQQYASKKNAKTHTVDIALIEKAIRFAKKWHAGQFRKMGEPYYSHPLEVAHITLDFCFKTDVIVAAILHDVVEDSACTVALIAQEFNPRIAQIVHRLTRLSYGSDNPETKLSIEAIMTNLKQLDDKEAMLIKEIDRLHNLATAQRLEQGKQSKMVTETFKSIISQVAHTVDELNINNKLRLEEHMYKHCKSILSEHKK